MDDIKDTLDDDQLRLFEEMRAAADSIEYDANAAIGTVLNDESMETYDIKD